MHGGDIATTKQAPSKTAETALANLLKQDAELHAKIAKAANGITQAVVKDSLTAAFGADPSKDTTSSR